MSWRELLAAARETKVQQPWGRASLRKRALAVAPVWLVVVSWLLLLLFYLKDAVDMPGLGPLSGELVGSLVWHGAQVLLILVLGHVSMGLRNIYLTWRGAALSCLLILPLFLISLVDAPALQWTGWASLLAIVSLGLLISLAESVFGLGIVLTLWGGRQRAAFAVVAAAVTFSYLHIPTYTLQFGLGEALLRSTQSAAFSIAVGIIVLRSGSMVGPLLFHAINDALMLLQPARMAAPAAHATNPTAIVMGLLISAAYWLLLRNGIAREQQRDAAP